MAKIVGGSLIGELSGKEAGRVFSRNRAGAYTRQYVVPVNPKTNAQEAARQKFGNAAQSYHNLDPASKAQWGNFAQAVFSPKVGVNNGQFSGFNAYTSLRMNVNQGQGLAQSFDVEVNGAAPVMAPTFEDYTFLNTPPNFALQANIADQTGGAVNQVLSDAVVRSDGSFEFTLDIGPGIIGGTDIGDFVDGSGTKFGYMVQMSESKPQGGMFYANPYRYTLGTVKPPSLDVADRTGVETLKFTSTTNINPANYQSFPLGNDVVRVSCWNLGKEGMVTCLGDVDIVITPV